MAINTKIKYNSSDVYTLTKENNETTILTAGKHCSENFNISFDCPIYNGEFFIPGDLLCFTANTASSTIAMSVHGTPTLGQNFKYTFDGIWTEFVPGQTTITLTNIGDKVYFKGNNPNGVNQTDSIYYQFVMAGSIAVSGSIMSLIDNGACNTLIIPNAYCFYCLFDSCPITTPPKLPALTLSTRAYDCMFYRCASLITSPTLPATNLGELCYRFMFGFCTSLTKAPNLSSTTLAPACYTCMFYGCSSLTTAPSLSATTLTNSCYASMFYGCTLLNIVPKLPATTLDTLYYCYQFMFYNCSSLKVYSSSGTGHTTTWRIPTSGTGTGTASNIMSYMLSNTGGNVTDTPAFNTTYYVENSPV